MATNSSSFTLLVISAIIITTTTMILLSSTVDASGDHHHHQFDWNITTTTSTSSSSSSSSTCEGSIAECFGSDEELEMDSEINRRILAATKHLSYEFLKRNNVPCSIPGASYYNCKPGAQANPKTRGCSSITKCKS